MTTTTARPLNATEHDSTHSPDTLARIALCLSIEPGNKTAGTLISSLGAEEALNIIHGGNAAAAAGMVPAEELDQLKGTARPINGVSLAIRTAARYGMTIITPGHEHWNSRLADLGDQAPYALWVRGDPSLLVDPTITAICGARAATGYGEHVTMEITSGLVDQGHTIISGAAYGIDGMAHRATLAASGRTIAVLAGGADRYHPSGHEALLTRIAEAGAVVSEMPPASAPTKWRFLQRNRLIAAVAGAVVITEAGWRSGSLNTAGHATALGRPLGAVPGPVTSAASAGCHRLIRDFDATLVTNAAEAAELQ